MSIAWDMDIPSTEKMVLLCLCDYADDNGRSCYPAISTLAKRTSKNARTVQRALRWLESAELVVTNVRQGTSADYTLNTKKIGESKCETTHYVYRTRDVDTGDFYIGARSCYGQPEDDDYLGSGVWVAERKAAGAALAKDIISVHESRTKLGEAESVLISAFISDLKCMNRMATTPGNLSPRHFDTPSKTTQRGDTTPPNPPRTTKIVKDKSLTIEKPQKPDGVEQIVWDDFLKHRKAKRAPLTETALTAIAREAFKAGWTMNDAIAEIVARNWQSFKAIWVKDNENGNTQGNSGNRAGNGRTNGFARALQHVADGPFDEPFGNDRQRM